LANSLQLGYNNNCQLWILNTGAERLCVFVRLNVEQDNLAEGDVSDMPQVTLYVAVCEQSCLSVIHYSTLTGFLLSH